MIEMNVSDDMPVLGVLQVTWSIVLDETWFTRYEQNTTNGAGQ